MNKQTDSGCQRRLFNQQKKAPQKTSNANDDHKKKKKFRCAKNSRNIKSAVVKRSMLNRRP